jgi:hypothetical protein
MAHNRARVDQDHMIAIPRGQCQVVQHDATTNTFGGFGTEQVHQFELMPRVESSAGLVGEQDFGTRREGASE